MMIKHRFNILARPPAELDEEFKSRPFLLLEKQAFDVFSPIADIFEKERVYGRNEPLGVPEMIEEMQQMCSEAFTSLTSEDNAEIAQRRQKLFTVLQSVKETYEEYGVDENEQCAADMSLFSLHEYVSEIREAAVIHSQYYHNKDVHDALMAIATDIQSAPKRLWQPVSRADDYEPGQAMDVA